MASVHSQDATCPPDPAKLTCPLPKRAEYEEKQCRGNQTSEPDCKLKIFSAFGCSPVLVTRGLTISKKAEEFKSNQGRLARDILGSVSADLNEASPKSLPQIPPE